MLGLHAGLAQLVVLHLVTKWLHREVSSVVSAYVI